MALLSNSVFKKPDGIYLLNHSVGCLPVNAERIASDHYFHPWETMGGNAWQTWTKSITTFRQSLAGIFCANETDFCPQNNVSSAIAKILFSLPHRSHKNTILVSEHDFPSTIFAVTNACSSNQNIVFLSLESPVFDLNIWEKKLTNDVDIVLITHVTSNLSQLAPVKEIIQLAKKNDIITIVDIAQSAGVIPINFREWNADFVVGSCVKWLCGGPGAGFMWVNPAILHQCKPRDVGWFSHVNPFEFDVHHFEYANDALRFWGGTPNVLPFVIAGESIRQIAHIGVHTIRKHNQTFIELIYNAAQACNLTVVSPQKPENRGGTITLNIKNVEKTTMTMKKNRIFFDVRLQHNFRFSPHIYTTRTEIDAFIDVLQLVK